MALAEVVPEVARPSPRVYTVAMLLNPPTSTGIDSDSLSEQEDEAPPRPPLPELYSPEDQPPAVPPLPREATIIRHTSVRGLKRQSDERKRDRELGQCVNGDSRVSRKGGLLCGWREESETLDRCDNLGLPTGGAPVIR